MQITSVQFIQCFSVNTIDKRTGPEFNFFGGQSLENKFEHLRI